jgi:hypothetical protein
MKVIFKKFKGEIIALFPEVIGDAGKVDTCMSYQHIGQHGSASVHLPWKTCKPEEYADLLQELKSLGYSDLYVGSKFTVKDQKLREQNK